MEERGIGISSMLYPRKPRLLAVQSVEECPLCKIHDKGLAGLVRTHPGHGTIVRKRDVGVGEQSKTGTSYKRRGNRNTVVEVKDQPRSESVLSHPAGRLSGSSIACC